MNAITEILVDRSLESDPDTETRTCMQVRGIARYIHTQTPGNPRLDATFACPKRIGMERCSLNPAIKCHLAEVERAIKAIWN